MRTLLLSLAIAATIPTYAQVGVFEGTGHSIDQETDSVSSHYNEIRQKNSMLCLYPDGSFITNLPLLPDAGSWAANEGLITFLDSSGKTVATVEYTVRKKKGTFLINMTNDRDDVVFLKGKNRRKYYLNKGYGRHELLKWFSQH